MIFLITRGRERNINIGSGQPLHKDKKEKQEDKAVYFRANGRGWSTLFISVR